MQIYPPGLCLMSPRSLLTGSSGEALGNIVVDELADGALCFVTTNGLYRLDKTSTVAVSSPFVIATARGDGVPGRWILLQATAAGAAGFSAAKIKTVNVPFIANGQNSNVVAFTDSDYIGCNGLFVSPILTPPDNLVIAAAWMSNPNIGEAIMRFAAVGANVPNESQDFVCCGIRVSS